MSWPMIHGGAGHPLFSVRLSLRMIAPSQGCLVDRHRIGSPIARLPLNPRIQPGQRFRLHDLPEQDPGPAVLLVGHPAALSALEAVAPPSGLWADGSEPAARDVASYLVGQHLSAGQVMGTEDENALVLFADRLRDDAAGPVGLAVRALDRLSSVGVVVDGHSQSSPASVADVPAARAACSS